MLRLPLVLHCEDNDDDRSNREEDDKDDERDGLGVMTRQLGRNLSRLCSGCGESESRRYEGS